MYLPLLVYERTSGLLVGVRLRTGNIHPARFMLALLRLIVEALQHAFLGVQIIIRADAGQGVPELYEFCEANGLGYLVGIAANPVFKRHAVWAVGWLSPHFEGDGKPCAHRWLQAPRPVLELQPVHPLQV